ncbi:uncharacterized protein LOC109824773 isoform X3 [Asparagus officinalis]|uniref:uncharacterized protein LOC109824773 isoform X3 n=1 Tax=Asparagus officinalis TaxID=4686 RepID=UPI00098E827B|nr:uncharacterized protein LOC109824773 isoform X3 [Asparagus officinalis]
MSTARATDEVPESPAKKAKMKTEEEECVHVDEQDLSDDEFYNDGLHMMTAEEMERYGEAVMRSDGFEVPELPNVFAFGLIIPYINNLPTKCMEEILKYARFAIDRQNEERVKEGARELRLDITRIVNCNVQVACPINYYITFEANDLDTNELDQYEAKVVTSVCHDDDEVPIFRKKAKPTNPPVPTEACKNHKKLSYAGRLQVIKSSILGIQVFWTSNYILPVRVLKKIDELCRQFLWGKYDQSAKTVLAVSWEKVCLDKKKGGLRIFSASIWNLASAVKLLWYLHINKECLWIKWVNGTYLKNCNVWQVQAKRGDSWMWKQILRARDKAVELSGNVDNLKQMIKASSNSSKIKIAKIYSALSPASNSVPWHNMVWGGLSYPKHSFICWLAVNNRLQTQDRLLRQRIVNANKCKLCTGPCLESRDHLFFECSFSKEVWNQIMDWLLFKWRSCSWNSIINWYCTNLRKKGIKQNIKRAALSATIYHIWYERNLRMFQQVFKSEGSLVKRIKVDILTICINSPNIAGNLTDWISPV